MGGGLVEEQQPGPGGDAGQAPGQAQAAQLPGTELVRVRLGQPGQSDSREGVVGGSGVVGVELDLVEDGLADGVDVLRHPGHCSRVDPVDGSFLGFDGSGEDPEQGGFAAAAGAFDAGDGSAENFGVETGYCWGGPSWVAHDHAADPHQGCLVRRSVRPGVDRCGVRFRRRRSADVGGRGLGDDLPGAMQGCHAVLGGVEGCAEVAEGGEAFRGEDEGNEPHQEVEVTVNETHADEHRHDGDRERGDQLEHQRGEESGAQGHHGRVPVLLGDIAQRRSLLLDPPQAHEDGQSTGEFDQVVGEPLKNGGRLPGLVLGVQSDQCHEHRDQGHGEHDDEGADPVGGQNPRPDQQRHGGGGGDRGQHARVVVVEGVEADGAHGGRGADVVAAPGHEAGGEFSAQPPLRPTGGADGDDLGGPGDCGTQQPGTHPDQQSPLPGRRVMSDDPDDAAGQGFGHADQSQSLERSEEAEGEDCGSTTGAQRGTFHACWFPSVPVPGTPSRRVPAARLGATAGRTGWGAGRWPVVRRRRNTQ